MNIEAISKIVKASGISAGEQFELYRSYMSRLFAKLMECKRFTQIRIPTSANAAESNLDPQDYIRRIFLFCPYPPGKKNGGCIWTIL